jgi:uncharacterized membrane protein YfcA
MISLDSLFSFGTVGVLLSITLASYVQNLTGFAFGLIFLALVGTFNLIPVETAANAVTLITLSQIYVYFRSSPLTDDWRVIRPVVLPSLVGVVAGLALLFWLNDKALYLLKIALGISIMCSAALLVIQFEPKSKIDVPKSFMLPGLLAGLMGGLFATPGPPLVYKFYRQPLSLPVIRQALLLLFGLSQLARLGIVLISGQFTTSSIPYALMAVPLLFLVTWYTQNYPMKLSPGAVCRVAGGLLLLTGICLIVST